MKSYILAFLIAFSSFAAHAQDDDVPKQICSSNREELEEFLEQNPQALTFRDPQGSNLLHIAALCASNEATLRYLIDKNVDPYKLNAWEDSPFRYASLRSKPQISNPLLLKLNSDNKTLPSVQPSPTLLC